MAEQHYFEAVAALSAQVEPEALAEWHGGVTGILCAAAPSQLSRLLHALGPPGGEEVELLPAQEQAVPADLVQADAERLVLGTGAALADPAALEFVPAIADDVPLSDRALCLGAWCQGFLYGLATTLPRVAELLGGEAREVLDDFGEIARAVRGGEDAETAETAYAELIEFVRVGVALVYEELRAVRNEARGDGETLQ